MNKRKPQYRVYHDGVGGGVLCRSLTEALDLARHLLKQGRSVSVDPETPEDA